MKKKERLDKILVEGQLCDTRSQAQGLVLAGKVRLDGSVLDKPGTMLLPEVLDKLTVEAPMPYVSRGGLKLEKALATFSVDPTGRICLDIGASSGGFTDCLLQKGARKVYAVDVGYGQLDWRLRQDSRVVSMEKTNIRHLAPEAIPEKATLAVTDVSFISIKKVLPGLMPFMDPDQPSEIIALLKPQFEYKDYLNDKDFKGVVRGEAAHRLILASVIRELLDAMPGWWLSGITYSPVLGPKGNREFPLHLVRGAGQTPELGPLIEALVAECYEFLREN